MMSSLKRSGNTKYNLFYYSLFLLFFFTNSYCLYAANQPSIGTRTLTFTNNCSQPIWFGLISGSAPSLLATGLCSTDQDCYPGSSCVQTGKIKRCFWTPPTPSNNNFQLNANGGTNSVTIPIYSNPKNIIWSGAVAGRTNCAGGVCETADCGTGTAGCNAGSGFQQPATQAEFTLLTTSSDYYDVEIINGFNIPIQMSPSSAGSTPSANPYVCGSPGASNPSSSLLGSCSWAFNPPTNDYRWVKKGGKSCSVDSDCQSPTVCGLSSNPGHNPPLLKTCGALLGYFTADQICGVERGYGEPINCSTPLPAPQNNLTLSNLYGCTSVGSCYSSGANNTCCGCVNWDQEGIPVPKTPYTFQCVSSNPNWTNYAEPSLIWLKSACPTAYVYPYDDKSSTFTCSNMQKSVNVMNYNITFCPNNQNNPPPTQSYSYTVYTGYPFNPVTINNSITCPDPTSKNPACLVTSQSVSNHLTIKGSANHLCDLSIQSNGSVLVNTNSIGCAINSSSATTSKPGVIALPSKF